MLFTKVSVKYAAKFLVVGCLNVFLVACVSSGGKNKQPNITRMDDIDADHVEYADDVTAESEGDDRFSAPVESEGGDELDPYDNPQYAVESDEDADIRVDDSADLYDDPQYADEVESDVVAGEEALNEADSIDSETLLVESDSSEGDISASPAEVQEVAVVYEQVGIDENGQPIMAVVEPVDPLEKFGSNPYLQNPPMVTAEAAASFSDALALMREDKLDEASVVFESISENNHLLSGPAYNRAVIAYKQDDMKLTLKWLSISLERNAYNLDAKNLKANVYKKQAKFKEAEAEYLSIISMWGAYLPAYKNLGILYDMYMGKLALALEQYRLYEALSPEEDKKVTGWIAVISRKIEVEPVPVEPTPQQETEGVVGDQEGTSINADSDTDSVEPDLVDEPGVVEENDASMNADVESGDIAEADSEQGAIEEVEAPVNDAVEPENAIESVDGVDVDNMQSEVE